MILRFFREDPRRRQVDRLHERVAAASRRPGLYTGLGVPDTVEGRFEALALHLILVVRRLSGLPPPADDVAQELVDSTFRHLDVSLREMGVGDLTVPKRIKKLAAAFYGRVQAYGAALDGGDRAALLDALGRNVTGEGPATGGGAAVRGLADYVVEAEHQLASQDLDTLLGEGPRFPAVPEIEEEGTR